MDMMIWKIRLSILGIFGGVGWVVAFVLNLLLSGVIQGIIAGTTGNSPITEPRLILYALFYILPFTMALLCLTLRDVWNHRVNIIMGILFAFSLLMDLLIHTANLINGGQESPGIWQVMLADLGACLLIIVLAWKNYPVKQA